MFGEIKMFNSIDINGRAYTYCAKLK